jgi:two-component system, NtrC family, response regulator AtoC
MPRARRPPEEETVNAAGRPQSTTLSLRIVLGDRVITQELPEQGTLLVGRSEDADVFVDHRSVSRSHARLHVETSSVAVEDLRSANGTRIGGVPAPPETRVPLRPGDAVELGDVLLVLQRGSFARRAARDAQPTPLGNSPPMRQVSALVESIAAGRIAALIVGETGVGKELVAETIHRRSPRAARPLVRLNCAAVAESLLESEWFGHERGAFTGALEAKPGLLETAEGGTVLLDEVGEMPMALQAKLLRVLEDRAVMRVGGVKPRRIDVRFLAATHRDLEADIARGAFRPDLYFRLNGVTIRVPPLRERPEEIAPLARTFAAEASDALAHAAPPSIDPEAMAWLESHAWPGNVRELRNIIERAVLLAGSASAITTAHLPAALRPAARPERVPADASPDAPQDRLSLREAIADVEKQRVLEALAQAGGNQKRAAEILGIARGTLVARLEAFGIARPRKRGG